MASHLAAAAKAAAIPARATTCALLKAITLRII
jgi:hypothetical protein